jgi:predicted alpha-1,2-mannosidase
MKHRATVRLSFLLSLGTAMTLVLLGFSPPASSVQAEPVLAASQLNLTQYVNPFIGTNPCSGCNYGFGFDTGDVFPGAAYPMGMVQMSPDTPSNIPGGYYYPDSTIKDFSLTHFSGRGCTDSQDIPFMPFVGSSSSSSSFSHSSEVAHPGYYKVLLSGPNVTVELTATLHTGMAQLTYPSSTQSGLYINAGGAINGTSNASVAINTSGQEVTGQATSTVGCGGSHYTIYFAAHFDRAFSSSSGNGTSAATLFFDTTSNQVVHVRFGVSYVSLANAEANLTAENNGSASFSTIESNADAAWNTRLNTIQVSGGTSTQLTVFYTALYHTFFHPNIFSDVNGQYIGFDGQVHTVASGHAQYENISSWDIWRSQISLRAILAPSESADIAQSLVNDAQQGDGHLPRWEQKNADSKGMNGDGADIEIADIYAFGDTGFDASGALTAMVNGQSKLREGYSDYVSKGYVTQSDTGNSAASTQEFTNDDFAISQLALALGNMPDYTTYLQRSNNWVNLFNSAAGGYIFPRNSDGSWASTSPTSGTGFQEDDSAQSTWMEPFDLASLSSRMGGNATVVSRLNTFFTQVNAGPGSQYAYMGNEPSLETPWTYDFVGAPAQTESVVRRIQDQLYTNTPGGLPGNDDGGAMSSWYVFSAIGLFPDIPGVGGFVIGSPLFPSITIQLAGGHTLQINATNAADGNPYVQSMTVNGTASTKLWLPWSTVANGVTLGFTLGSSASSWGTGASDAPPSFPPTTNTTFNNEGISNDNNTSVGNFDGGGYSYSNNALEAAGFSSGATVTVNGVSFLWPTVAAGSDDNWQAAGQVIPVNGSAGAATLAFLGAATSGPSSGTATITYTDGSTQTFTLAFSDWTLNGGKSTIISGDSIAVQMTYRNTSTGQQTNHPTYVFYTSVSLQAGKTIKSVTLPSSVSQGTLHVFAVSAGGGFNNEGISSDSNTTVANYDGVGNSYSNNALGAAGFSSGATVTVNGISFQWPAVAAGANDNWQVSGQVVPLSGTGSTLAFLGSATNGPSSGTITVTYTDGSTQTFTLAFSDWTLNGGSSQIISGDSAACTMTYRNTPSGQQTRTTYVFYTSVTLASGKTVKSVTLPSSVNQGHLHVFAIGIGG